MIVVLLSTKGIPLWPIENPLNIPERKHIMIFTNPAEYRNLVKYSVTNDMQMYGCNIETFKESVKQSITYRYSGGAMVVAGLMSDAQEMMAHGDSDSARMYLNRAKALVFDMVDGSMSFGPTDKFTS
jgi:hypothetical protein